MLIDVNTVLCDGCGAEWTFKKQDIIFAPESNESIFMLPLCKECGAQAGYQWHNFVQLKQVSEERSLPGDEGTVNSTMPVNWFEPDPEHPMAEQMVLIERIAKTIPGMKMRDCKAEGIQPADTDYPTDRRPRAPARESVQREVEVQIGRRMASGMNLIRTKDQAENDFLRARQEHQRGLEKARAERAAPANRNGPVDKEAE